MYSEVQKFSINQSPITPLNTVMFDEDLVEQAQSNHSVSSQDIAHADTYCVSTSRTALVAGDRLQR